MEKVYIKTSYIELDKFLKLVTAVPSGGAVKELLNQEKIIRNGQIETAKRRKLQNGDIIEIVDEGKWQVIAKVE